MSPPIISPPGPIVPHPDALWLMVDGFDDVSGVSEGRIWGFLTAEQALAAAEMRARPPQLDAIIATLPEDAALAARITLATMSEERRGDPLFAALITEGRATAKQVDELFRQAKML